MIKLIKWLLLILVLIMFILIGSNESEQRNQVLAFCDKSNLNTQLIPIINKAMKLKLEVRSDNALSKIIQMKS
ncbi:MAG: hypothetical protein HQL46_14030 [Gammaproteobacteria bacterium]|nr:hypothetical protein [Gammaproteobacteria bacterium]